MPLTRILVLISIFLAYSSVSIAQLVSVQQVKFTFLKNNWFVGEIQILTDRNTDPQAISDKFVENVNIRLYLGFQNDNLAENIDYYVAQSDIMILEQGDKNTVRFFIPDKIIKMHRYRMPQFYYAEVVVNKKVQKLNSRAFSSNINSKQSLDVFMQKALQGMKRNPGRLIPSYHAPNSVQGSDPGAPIYLNSL
tara:strand:- start:186 stop:764 length:579 start_codon:yes stop_codon:yes gene_type:complete